MSYLEALNKVEGALARRAKSNNEAFYMIDKGEILATEGHVSAGAPFPDTDLSFVTKAALFEKALKKFKDCDIKVIANGRKVRLQRNKSYVDLPCVEVALAPRFPRPEGKRYNPPKDFVEYLTTLRHWAVENEQKRFAEAFRLRQANVTVTNNMVIARIDFVDAPPWDHLIPFWAFTAVAGRNVTAVMFNEHSFSFLFADGSWLRSPVIEDTFPDDTCDKLLAVPPATWAISGEFREALDMVTSLGGSMLRIDGSGVYGVVRPGIETDVDVQSLVETPLTEDAKYQSDNLEAVVRLATHIDMGIHPSPWHGAMGLKGVIGKAR